MLVYIHKMGLEKKVFSLLREGEKIIGIQWDEDEAMYIIALEV
jgi:hypothetical protein